MYFSEWRCTLNKPLEYNAYMLADLERQLNDFSLEKRTAALHQLIQFAQQNPTFLPEQNDSVNMHCHSFFSFNAYGYSPSALVWLAKRLGLRAVGIVDFDNLDGVEEFLAACDHASIRGSAAMETRIYIPEMADLVTNSPGEPGVSYSCGVGFTSQSVNKKGSVILRRMREQSETRNRSMVGKLNAFLDPLRIDYDADVLPLTPSGNATERHMLAAYMNTVEINASDPAKFWADKLGLEIEFVQNLIKDEAAFSSTVRRKLMKRGGVAYVQPGPESFPTPDEFYAMVISNGALPTYNYLNGTTGGEKRLREVLELLVSKGAAAFNMIPNLAVPDITTDPSQSAARKNRAQLLLRAADLAAEFDLPLHIGTEMNSYGQRKVDDLASPELAPLRQRFIDGAHFIYGHVQLQRTLGIGYQSEWAASTLPTRAKKNHFYTQAGYLIPPGKAGIQALEETNPSLEPREMLSQLTQQVQKAP